MGIGTLLFLIWDINTVLNFQMFNLQGNAVLLCAFGFGFASMFFNLIAQITEKFTHTFLAGAVAMAFIVPMIVAGTILIFFY